ncbi:tryptophan-rich sensory protein [Chryseosolibacter indicus]|uniref:Tryptophan-rich sensory protein n=1 Tax=Chryseosolibacter indicus TaxID=2782351 RepID=A0ABS5VWZ2_9BACT|nr:TspO/MBR family protein [Chryseosolibacter indicus]MBT1704521.1 tryptophan-rich sensory protein [Chryseosolibacter indicus]
MNTKLSWWQIGLASVAISTIGGLIGRKPGKTEAVSYAKYKQAPWAPPPWLFGPAWMANNYFLLTGLQKLVNSDSRNKKTLLYLQIPIWAIFFSFGYVYANKKSPVLAAGWTVADALLAATSFAVALKQDKKLSYYFLPLLSWTSYASTVAVYQAVKNNDPVLHTKAAA